MLELTARGGEQFLANSNVIVHRTADIDNDLAGLYCLYRDYRQAARRREIGVSWVAWPQLTLVGERIANRPGPALRILAREDCGYRSRRSGLGRRKAGRRLVSRPRRLERSSRAIGGQWARFPSRKIPYLL